MKLKVHIVFQKKLEYNVKNKNITIKVINILKMLFCNDLKLCKKNIFINVNTFQT